jgi:pyruvate dehydrogenase E2 component (dihydrolipoamide acetyltransferase)
MLPVGAVIARLGTGAASPPPPPPPPPAAAVARAPGAKGELTIVEPSRAHGAIARRAAESRATIPDFTASVATADRSPARVVKACGVALREQPRVNGTYRDGRFELHARVNVGVVVATEDALAVPTIFDADAKPVEQIGDELRALTERAETGTLTPPEVAGATFTLAVLDVDRFTQVITPGQAAALAVGSVEMTLSCDHRILFGPDAARFLARLGELLG